VSSSLRANIRSGLIWSALQSWGGRFAILGLFMVVARVLSPADIGLFAMSAAVLALLTMLTDQGLVEAVVQRQHITQEQMNSVFWFNMAMSLIILAMLWVCAPALAAYLKSPEIVGILRVLSFALPLSAANLGQSAMKKRAFEYRWLALVTLAATGAGCVVALVMVLTGFGVWSLVAQTLVTTAGLTISLWSKPGWRLSRKTDFRGSLPLLKYGTNRITTAILEFSNTRYIEFFLAATLGPATLAVYTVGVRIYQALMQALGSTAYEIAHNGFSRLADDLPALANAYYKSVAATAAVAVPVFMLIAAVAPPLTTVLFGDRWLQSADVTRVVCVLGAIQLLSAYNGTVFNAIGRPGIGLQFTAAKVALTFVCFYAAQHGTLDTLLIAYFVSQALTVPLGFFVVKRLIGISMTELFRQSWPFLVGSVLMSLAAYGVLNFLTARHLPPLVSLIVASGAGGVIYLAFVHWAAPTTFRRAIDRIRSKG
jgi:O-antigen/teichoic acid export membrane protein